MNKTLHPASNTSLIEPLQIVILVEISVDLWIVIQDSSDSNPRFYIVTCAGGDSSESDNCFYIVTCVTI